MAPSPAPRRRRSSPAKLVAGLGLLVFAVLLLILAFRGYAPSITLVFSLLVLVGVGVYGAQSRPRSAARMPPAPPPGSIRPRPAPTEPPAANPEQP